MVVVLLTSSVVFAQLFIYLFIYRWYVSSGISWLDALPRDSRALVITVLHVLRVLYRHVRVTSRENIATCPEK